MLPNPMRKLSSARGLTAARTSDIPPPHIPLGHALMMYSPSTRWKTTFSDGRKSATGFAFTKTRDEHAEPPNPLSRFTVTTPSFSLGFGNDASDQLWFQQPDNDLEITVIGTADKRIIDDWPPPLTKRACARLPGYVVPHDSRKLALSLSVSFRRHRDGADYCKALESRRNLFWFEITQST